MLDRIKHASIVSPSAAYALGFHSIFPLIDLDAVGFRQRRAGDAEGQAVPLDPHPGVNVIKLFSVINCECLS